MTTYNICDYICKYTNIPVYMDCVPYSNEYIFQYFAVTCFILTMYCFYYQKNNSKVIIFLLEVN